MSLLDTFTALLQIDSPSGREEQIRQHISVLLSRLGVTARIDRTGNLFARVPGSGPPRILSAHLDTVEPGVGIKPRIIKGYIKSSGQTILGADNKAALACILHTLTNVPQSHRRPLELVFTVREETDGGIHKFDFAQLIAKIGLIADRSAPVGTIVLSSPWIENINIEVIGQSAHAGLPEEGRNALTCAAAAISSLKWGRLDVKTTANIGLMSAGSAENTIPGHVNIRGEVRSFSRSSVKKSIQKIHRLFQAYSLKHRTRLKFVRHPYCSGYVYTSASPGIQAAQRAIVSVGLPVVYQSSFGGSDANAFAARGFQVVNVGDGTEFSHTTKETLSVDSLQKLNQVLEAYITA